MRNSIMFLLVAACAANPASKPAPGSGSDTGSGSSSSMTPQEFVKQLATQECAHAYTCMAQYPATATDTFADNYGTDQQNCVQQDSNYASRDTIAADIAAGKITYDATAAVTCLSNLEFPASCTDFFSTWTYPSACDDALSGNVADGGACTTDWDCSGDNSVCTNLKCAPDTTM